MLKIFKNNTSLIILSVMFFCSCKEIIMHDLNENKANKVLVILNEYNISAEKVQAVKSYNIQVKSRDVVGALRALDKSRFLRRENAKNSNDDGKSMLSSKEQRQQLLERNLAVNLEETLEAIHVILEARVHFYLRRTEFGEHGRSASVLLILNDKVVTTVNEVKIKKMALDIISGAAGINKSDVNIVIVNDGINKSNVDDYEDKNEDDILSQNSFQIKTNEENILEKNNVKFQRKPEESIAEEALIIEDNYILRLKSAVSNLTYEDKIYGGIISIVSILFLFLGINFRKKLIPKLIITFLFFRKNKSIEILSKNQNSVSNIQEIISNNTQNITEYNVSEASTVIIEPKKVNSENKIFTASNILYQEIF